MLVPDEQTEYVIGWHWCHNENTAAYYAAGTAEKNASLVMASASPSGHLSLTKAGGSSISTTAWEKALTPLINQAAPWHVPGAYETRLRMTMLYMKGALRLLQPQQGQIPPTPNGTGTERRIGKQASPNAAAWL